MQTALPWIIGLSSAGLLVLALLLKFLRRPVVSAPPLPKEWAVSARPVFNADERRVYRLLREALPHHVLLSKLPLVRLCQPNDAKDVRYWYDLLGSINVSFVICSPNGRVLAALDLDGDRNPAQRNVQIKQSVLAACRIRYLHCTADNLPSVGELQLLVPFSNASTRGPQPAPIPTARPPVTSPRPASRRVESNTLWQDSSVFQDSFFAPDDRFDSLSGADFPSMAGGDSDLARPAYKSAAVTDGRVKADMDYDDLEAPDDIVGVVVDASATDLKVGAR
jgi:hypothetical protein